ncbi:hypothetical protein L596_009205 [Steinernema carpocapsae]|uniref:Uncharacterized protein n=1 Tax=Steinernema carpocapsae TaxID=34508 RepID=A0A4U5PEZ0_STECR|nr:hypothetical protein L596_009205 [Steinernema carpocapsae]
MMKFGHGPAKICKLGADRNWNYDVMKTAVRRLRLNGGIVERRKRSGRPKTPTLPNDVVAGLIREFLPRVRAVIDQERVQRRGERWRHP